MIDTDLDLATLDNNALDALVANLFAEEKRMSAKRTTLHQRIDFLRSGGYAHLDASTEQLETLLAEDRELSTRRVETHAQIDLAVAEQRKRASLRNNR